MVAQCGLIGRIPEKCEVGVGALLCVLPFAGCVCLDQNSLLDMREEKIAPSTGVRRHLERDLFFLWPADLCESSPMFLDLCLGVSGSTATWRRGTHPRITSIPFRPKSGAAARR